MAAWRRVIGLMVWMQSFRRNRVSSSGMERGTPGPRHAANGQLTVRTKAYIPLYATLTHLGRIPVRIEGMVGSTVGEKEGGPAKQLSSHDRKAYLFMRHAGFGVRARFICPSPPLAMKALSRRSAAPRFRADASPATPQEPRKPKRNARHAGRFQGPRQSGLVASWWRMRREKSRKSASGDFAAVRWSANRKLFVFYVRRR